MAETTPEQAEKKLEQITPEQEEQALEVLAMKQQQQNEEFEQALQALLQKYGRRLEVQHIIAAVPVPPAQ